MFNGTLSTDMITCPEKLTAGHRRGQIVDSCHRELKEFKKRLGAGLKKATASPTTEQNAFSNFFSSTQCSSISQNRWRGCENFVGNQYLVGKKRIASS